MNWSIAVHLPSDPLQIGVAQVLCRHDSIVVQQYRIFLADPPHILNGDLIEQFVELLLRRPTSIERRDQLYLKGTSVEETCEGQQRRGTR